MPHTVPSILHELTHLFFTVTQVAKVIPILQIRPMKHRLSKQLAHSLTAKKAVEGGEIKELKANYEVIQKKENIELSA